MTDLQKAAAAYFAVGLLVALFGLFSDRPWMRDLLDVSPWFAFAVVVGAWLPTAIAEAAESLRRARKSERRRRQLRGSR